MKSVIQAIKHKIIKILKDFDLFGTQAQPGMTEKEIEQILSAEVDPVDINEANYYLEKLKEMIDTGHFSLYLKDSTNHYNDKEIYLDSLGYTSNGKDEVIEVSVFFVKEQSHSEADDYEWRIR
jgi:hypothetical protein